MAANCQDVIMLLGDSLTQGGWEPEGFATRLAYAYTRKLDVINRGMSGYNTEWIKPIFEQCFATQDAQPHVPKVRILTIWLGANDAALPGTPQHIPLPTYASNLSGLIKAVTDPASPRFSSYTKIVLLTPPPVNTYQWLEHIRLNDPSKEASDRKFEVTQQYAEAVKEVGKKEGVPVVDLWTTFWDAVGHEERRLNELLTDGLHLNGRGYGIVFDELMKSVKANYPELHYENLGTVFALWDEINPQNPLPQLGKRTIVKQK